MAGNMGRKRAQKQVEPPPSKAEETTVAKRAKIEAPSAQPPPAPLAVSNTNIPSTTPATYSYPQLTYANGQPYGYAAPSFLYHPSYPTSQPHQPPTSAPRPTSVPTPNPGPAGQYQPYYGYGYPYPNPPPTHTAQTASSFTPTPTQNPPPAVAPAPSAGTTQPARTFADVTKSGMGVPQFIAQAQAATPSGATAAPPPVAPPAKKSRAKPKPKASPAPAPAPAPIPTPTVAQAQPPATNIKPTGNYQWASKTTTSTPTSTSVGGGVSVAAGAENLNAVGMAANLGGFGGNVGGNSGAVGGNFGTGVSGVQGGFTGVAANNSSSQGGNFGAGVYGTQRDGEGMVVEDNVDVDEVWLGNMRTKIVGIQYYRGIVCKNESVFLEREPRNPYDMNAIKVLNTRNEQVGHVPREVAARLAPKMDGWADLRVEGVVAGNPGVYSTPLTIQLYGTTNRLNEAVTLINSSRYAKDMVSVQPPDPRNPIFADEAALTGSQAQKTKAPPVHEILTRELENLYQSGGGGAYERMPMLEPPPLVTSPLYNHQKKALHWMVQAERQMTVEDALKEAEQAAIPAKGKKSKTPTSVFFYVRRPDPRKNGGVCYYNIATNNDMGLGKTITTLSLIAHDLHSTADRPAGSPRSTLIVCPLSVIGNWKEQIAAHMREGVSVYVYHGPDRVSDPVFLGGHNIVVTTYNVLAGDFSETNSNPATGLHAVNWRRVVLDEAHIIKVRSTKQAKAVFALEAECRWAVTGTPIQNKIDDMYSLIKFLRLTPFDDYKWWNTIITRPMRACDPVGLERLQLLISFRCLRRTKDMKVSIGKNMPLVPLVSLPPKQATVVEVDLSPRERQLYDKLFGMCRNKVQDLVATDAVGRNYAGILLMLLRLREICCHTALLCPDFLAKLESGDESAVAAAIKELGEEKVQHLFKLLNAGMADDCSICLEVGGDTVTRCGHVYHRRCMDQVLATGNSTCPLCRGPITADSLLDAKDEVKEDEGPGEEPAERVTAYSSKIEALAGYVQKVLSGDPCEKIVIVSQFTRLIDHVAMRLTGVGFPCLRLDGTMTLRNREAALQTFSKDPGMRVLLLSLKAGGVGLNLTAANHMVLMDPWWNVAAEDQAIDRVHRLGQTRPVTVARFVATATIEERIRELQESKRLLAEGALGQLSKAEMQRLRLNQTVSLFDA